MQKLSQLFGAYGLMDFQAVTPFVILTKYTESRNGEDFQRSRSYSKVLSLYYMTAGRSIMLLFFVVS
ncbi:MAG: hypothetical protein EXX96DRAFT_571808 [Benjaminiella poitrasii]|nr:MAG: hypothetical protein EXX96DRAFT_571808 [Benjaminiella poitrasii]